MEFRILGSLQVLDGERELPLGSPKERELLAVLLLHAGEVVSRERLIEELWGEARPATAGKALNVHVSQLRKALARNGDSAIATRPPGYVLEVEPERLDAARFERLVAAARARTAAGDVASARGLLGEALALWRGPALDGVELEATARNEVGRLDELRLAAEMDRIDCDLSLGHHEQLIGELEALVAEHPLRERLRGQLMLAHYRSGRQADALRCYREARETLVGELGIEPSLPLQRLERAILNQDASLEAPTGVARAARPPPALADTGRAARMSRIRGWRAAAVALRAVLVVTLIAVFVPTAIIAVTRERSPLRVPPDSLASIDPETNRVDAVAAVGVGPTAVAIAGHDLWVANGTDQTIWQFDARTLRRVRSIAVGDRVTNLSVAGGSIWATAFDSSTVLKLPTHSPAVPIVLRPERAGFATAPPHFTAVLADERGAWLGDDFGRVLRADEGRALRRIGYVFRPVEAIARVGSALWFATPHKRGFNGSERAAYATRFDLITHSVDELRLGHRPSAVASRGRYVWVALQDDGALARIDARDVSVRHITNLHARSVAEGACRESTTTACAGTIAIAHGSVWVPSVAERSVYRVDERSGRLIATIRVDGEPTGIASGAGRVWIVVR